MLAQFGHKLRFLALPLVVAAFFALTPTTAHAAYTDNNIIDDSVFLNSNSMSQADIQNFLNSKSGAIKNYSAPNTDPGQNNRMMSAAEIIYYTSQYVGISPRVIMATLQKEQSLITDPNPSAGKYNYAMGYGCPDSGGCSGSSGFYYQVVTGAWQLRLNFERAGGSSAPWTSPSGRTWGTNIGYACSGATRYYSTGLYAGRSVTFYSDNGTAYKTFSLDNRGTASMYCYTPHAYNPSGVPQYYSGSYNFVTNYESWWGSTKSVTYSSQYAGQSAYPSFAPGSTATGYIRYQNTGNSYWYDTDALSTAPAGTKHVSLATSRSVNRASAVGYPWGGDRNRVVGFGAVYESNGSTLTADQNVVQPGQIVQFNITFGTIGTTPAGTYREYFQPIVEGGTTMNDPGTFLDVVVTGIYESAYSSQSPSPTIRPSEKTTAFIAYKNTGNVVWYDDISIYGAPSGTNPIHLATSRTLNRSSAYGNTWGGDRNRPTGVFGAVYESNGTTLAANQNTVRPGQVVRFNIELSVPANASATTAREYFQPIVEGGTTMNDPGTFTDVTVPSSSVATASSSQITQISMAAGSSTALTGQFTNTGNVVWSSASVSLMPVAGTSAAQFRHSSWPSTSIASALPQSSVALGASVTFNFSVTAPVSPGTYNLDFAPGAAGSTFGSPNLKYRIVVAAPSYSSQYAGQSAYPSFKAGTTQAGHIRYKNIGNIAWYDTDALSTAPAGTKHVSLATSRSINRASAVGYPWGGDRNRVVGFGAVYESNGSTLAANQNVVQPGQIVQFNITFGTVGTTPAGIYREYFQPIVEGGTTMNDPGTFLDVVVEQQVYASQYAGQCAYPQMVAANTSSNCYLRYKNIGNMPWYDGISAGANSSRPVNLATSRSLNRFSLLGTLWNRDQNRAATAFGAVYESNGTTLAIDQHVAQPGQIVQYNFQLWAAEILPAGIYREYFQPIVEGGTIMNDPGTFIDARVTRP